MKISYKLIIGIIIIVLLATQMRIFAPVFNSLPYFQTNIYQHYEKTPYSENVITLITDQSNYVSLLSDFGEVFNLSSKELNFPTKVVFVKGGETVNQTFITYNDSEFYDIVTKLIVEQNKDGYIDIIGNDLGFAIYDKDFFIYYVDVSDNEDKILNILTSHGLRETKYTVKSRQSHFHLVKGKFLPITHDPIEA